MNQVDQNINKNMTDGLIDLESLNFSDNQTWLYKLSTDSGQNVDLVEYNLSCDWPDTDDSDYVKVETQLHNLLEEILNNDITSAPDKHKFDSRTYVKPKKRTPRPSLHTMVETKSNPVPVSKPSGNKYLTYNKYSNPLGPISPMLRLKTFNVDTNSDNSGVVKDFAAKRRSFVHDDADDPQLEDSDTPVDSAERTPLSKPINIDLSQPANSLHNTFNKGVPMMLTSRGSLNMYQSGESLMRMSPPSLVSSLMMDSSGHFQAEDNKSLTLNKDSGLPPTPGRESIDPMLNSMTLSILDEKDMSTSFLSQTTYPDHDSLIDSLPPSLVSSVNSSYVASKPKPKPSVEHNVFSSATFTHLEQSERLLQGRPRCQPFNSFKRDSLRGSESYTKSKDDTNLNDTFKVLNENSDKKDSPKSANPMSETIMIHYANNKFKSKDAEKENLTKTFEKDNAFYKDMGLKQLDLGRNSLNVTLDKQELNEIIQARQKLSMARKTLPVELGVPLPNQVDVNPVQYSNNETITVPKHSMENASELLARRRMGHEKRDDFRDSPKRNMTFKKGSAKPHVDATLVYDNHIIDINSATMSLTNSSEKTKSQEDWNPQSHAMVGSNESTDTGTFSSSSPHDSVPEMHPQEPVTQVASTPVTLLRKANLDLLHMDNTISPIYDTLDDKSYIVNNNVTTRDRTFDPNHTVINTGTFVRKSLNVKRDILAAKTSPEKTSVPNVKSPLRLSPTVSASQGTVGTMGIPRRSALPTSKLRQYSSHKELNRIPPQNNLVPKSSLPGRGALRRNVYASNPALSPTAQHPPQQLVPPRHAPSMMHPPIRRDSYTVTTDAAMSEKTAPRPALIRQGTETLRRERPHSQLVTPKDFRAPSATGPATITVLPAGRVNSIPQPSRPYSVAGSAALRQSRPSTVPVQKVNPATSHAATELRPSSTEYRSSALPRPTRLPGPRRTLRPPSVYSVAPTADYDQY